MMKALRGFVSILLAGGSAGCNGLADNAFDIPRASTTPVRVSADHRFVAISSGFFHTCAIDTSGRAWCWGDNSYQQAGQVGGILGDGHVTQTVYPVAVVAG
jgi:alpha-tubulin suppressor-like RCC1 family protein